MLVQPEDRPEVSTDAWFAIILVALSVGILVGFYARTTDKDNSHEQ